MMADVNETDEAARTDAVRPQIAVVGPGDADEREMQLACGVGRLLALGGAIVVTGGLGGVMHGACEGAALGAFKVM